MDEPRACEICEHFEECHPSAVEGKPEYGKCLGFKAIPNHEKKKGRADEKTKALEVMENLVREMVNGKGRKMVLVAITAYREGK